MTTFICKECGFRFESANGTRCPYCAGKKIEVEKNAEELVSNIEDKDF